MPKQSSPLVAFIAELRRRHRKVTANYTAFLVAVEQDRAEPSFDCVDIDTWRWHEITRFQHHLTRINDTLARVRCELAIFDERDTRLAAVRKQETARLDQVIRTINGHGKELDDLKRRLDWTVRVVNGHDNALNNLKDGNNPNDRNPVDARSGSKTA